MDKLSTILYAKWIKYPMRAKMTTLAVSARQISITQRKRAHIGAHAQRGKNESYNVLHQQRTSQSVFWVEKCSFR